MISYDEFLEFHKNIIGGAGQTYEEAFRLCTYTLQTNVIDGVVVEVGVAHGGTAQILDKYKLENKKLFLFDTFEGLQDCSLEHDGHDLTNGSMSYGQQTIIDMFKNRNVEIFKGYFPESASGVLDDVKISFLHLDVDTYQSTLNGLKYCYNKMSVGGVIVIHDYVNNSSTKGVSLAVNEFLLDKIETVIVPEGGPNINHSGHGNTHCIIIKQ